MGQICNSGSPWLWDRPVAVFTTTEVSGPRDPPLNEGLHFDGSQEHKSEFDYVYPSFPSCANSLLPFLALHTMNTQVHLASTSQRCTQAHLHVKHESFFMTNPTVIAQWGRAEICVSLQQAE